MSSNVPSPAGPVPEADLRLETRPAGLPSASSPPRLRRGRLVLCVLFLTAVTAVGGLWLWHRHRVQTAWRQAETALAHHDLASALLHFDRYLEHRPRDAAAWFLAGRTARRLGRFSEAERYLEHCQQLTGVTEATRLEWDLLRVQQGDLGEVHRRLRMTITPNHPDALLVLEALAQGYVQTDRLMDAMQACDLWSARQPDHPRPFLWRGEILERLGHNQMARADFQRALDNAPDDRTIRLAMGRQLVRARQPAAAAEHYSFLVDRNPQDAEALLGLAGCRIDQGRPEEAVPLLERLLEEIPNLARGLFLRGKAALEMKDAASAERWLASAVQEAPEDVEFLHQYILALRARDKDAEANRLVPRLEAMRKDLTRLNELIAVIAKKPEEAQPRHEAGVLALRLGRPEDAVRWFQSALRARGDHRPTHAALAEHFRRTGDPRADYHRRLAQPPE